MTLTINSVNKVNVGFLSIVAILSGLALPVHAQSASSGCAASNQIPLTSQDIRGRAFKLGIANPNARTSKEILKQNQDIGRSFQEFVQRSKGIAKENGYNFQSSKRENATKTMAKKYKGVRPDFVWPVIYGSLLGIQDSSGAFIEVKATGETLTLKYNYFQILGHIDAVSSRLIARLNSLVGGTRLLFITTSDTNVSPSDTMKEAYNSRVAIYRAVVCGVPGKNILQVGPAKQLNNVQGNGTTFSYVSAGKVNGLLKRNIPVSIDWEDHSAGY